MDDSVKPSTYMEQTVQDILAGQGLQTVEKQRKALENEVGLVDLRPSGSHRVSSKVVCSAMDPQGSSFLALGTGQGQVLLIDCSEHRTAAQVAAFDEEVRCLALCAGRVAAAGSSKVVVYNVPDLVEASSLTLPSEAQLLQLRACGSLWLCTLQADGTCAAFQLREEEGKLASNMIFHFQQCGGARSTESSPAVWSFQLANMSPAADPPANLPAPAHSSLHFAALAPAPLRVTAPLFLLFAGSCVLQSYCLLEGTPPNPYRRFCIPSEITVLAATPCGCAFAAGGSNGCVALFGTMLTLALQSLLPGHYAAVSALAFQGAETLLSVGRDGWVHHYSVSQQAVVFRCQLAPPAVSTAATAAVAASAVPLGLVLDEAGRLRLTDLRGGSKLAKVTGCELHSKNTEGAGQSWLLASNVGFCLLCSDEECGELHFLDHKDAQQLRKESAEAPKEEATAPVWLRPESRQARVEGYLRRHVRDKEARRARCQQRAEELRARLERQG